MVKALAFTNMAYNVQALPSSYAFSSYSAFYIDVPFVTIIFYLHVL